MMVYTHTAKIAIQCLNIVMNNGESLQFIVFLIIADAKVKASISKQENKTKRLNVGYSSIMYFFFVLIVQFARQSVE